MASARKRPRAEAEENRAECPFSVKIVDTKEKEKGQKMKKRRRTDGGDDEETDKKNNLQMSPFSPSGRFRTHETLDVHYRVDPPKKWTDMTRYNSFVLNGIKYFSEGFIFVANDSSIEQMKAVGDGDASVRAHKKGDDDWVARILEIRASDEHHVYARVFWMYWPDELPGGTHDGKKIVQGRQPYHGTHELIASNHMDIINVVSVTAQATVKQWYEENEDDVQNTLYWRQAFDVRTYELSSVENVCSCKTPEHPDKMMVGCTSDSCGKWMHEQCLKDAALKDVYKRLGTSKPYIAKPPVKEEREDGDDAKRPLSPTETGAGVSIDVKPGGDGAEDGIKVGSDNVEVKQPEDEDAPRAPEDSLPEQSSSTTVKAEAKATPAKGTPGRRGPGRPRKNPELNGESSRPWEGLFEATVKTNVSPSVVEFKDLREGVVGGEKVWTEPLHCLLCGSIIN